MRAIAVATLALTLLVREAYSQHQNWEYTEYGNPIDGEYQIQSTPSIGPPPQDALLAVSNKGGRRFVYIIVPKSQMCAFAHGDELPAKAAFDGNVHDTIVEIANLTSDSPYVAIDVLYDDRWIDLIHESDNLYIRLYQDCGNNIDYEFDISGPVTIPAHQES